jgi:hypothetical protein
MDGTVSEDRRATLSLDSITSSVANLTLSREEGGMASSSLRNRDFRPDDQRKSMTDLMNGNSRGRRVRTVTFADLPDSAGANSVESYQEGRCRGQGTGGYNSAR